MASDCGSYFGEVLVGPGYMGDFTDPGADAAWSGGSGRCWPPVPLVCTNLWQVLDAIGANYWVTPCPTLDVNLYYRGALGVQVVDDYTGPRGLEHLPAIEFSGSGWGEANITFVGGYWKPAIGSRWTAQGWIRAADGQLGVSVGAGYADRGWASTFLMTYAAPVQAGWTFFKTTFVFQPIDLVQGVNGAFPVFSVAGPGIVNQVTKSVSILGTPMNMTKYDQIGTYHMKCLHLYPEGSPRIVTGGPILDQIAYRT